MAYQVDKFNGTFLVSVEDGTIDTTTDLRFVGKNYAGYGEVQNENFLHLMENFANTSAPPKVVTGQIWYDSGEKKLKFYNGSRWKVSGGAESSSTAPSGLAVGEFWWDTSAKQLYTYTGTDFVLVGPQASPDLGISGASTQVVKDTANTNHYIVKLTSNSKLIAVISDSAFTVNSSVDGFEDFTGKVIKKGVTLANTNGTTGVSSNDYVFWGSASNALKLGGVDASLFVQKGAIVFDQEIKFNDSGLQIGDSNDLRVRVENNDEVIFENRLGNNITFRITVVDGVDERDTLIITDTALVPGDDAVFSIGASSVRWNNVYAVTFTGNLTGNVTGNVTGNTTGNLLATDSTVLVNATSKQLGYDGAAIRGNLIGSVQGNLTGVASNASKLNSISPSITIPTDVDKTSVAVRDSNGSLTANQFIGISDKVDRVLIDDSAVDPTWTSTVSTHYRTAKTGKVAFSIAARDSSGNLLANLFDGTATAAQYADLAEKYLPDTDYEPGTVMVIGGEKEVTASSAGQLAIGVISTNPAYMMNKDLEGGVYVALKGRVPVKVLGPVKKGDHLVADENGCAIVCHGAYTFAVALETSEDTGLKLIESVIL